MGRGRGHSKGVGWIFLNGGVVVPGGGGHSKGGVVLQGGGHSKGGVVLQGGSSYKRGFSSVL